MKAALGRLRILVILLTCSLGTNAAEHLRPPAVPLVTHDPYFSIWSQGDRLTDVGTTHWTGKPHRLTSAVWIDGKGFRVMGTTPVQFPALPQTGLEVLPTRTIYTFEGESVRLTLTFMSPALPDDLMIYSRPVTYVTASMQALDGKEHKFQINFYVNAEIAVNDPNQAVTGVTTERVENLTFVRVGSAEQPVLKKKGDDLRIDWGYLYLAAVKRMEPDDRIPETMKGPKPRPGDSVLYQTKSSSVVIRAVWDVPEPASAKMVSFATACFNFRTLPTTQPVSRWLMLAYDAEFSIQYFRKNLRPYWRRNGDDAAALLKKAAADYESLKKRCEQFDAELLADLRRVGGEKYAQLCALAYRQTFAGSKIVADANGQPLMFPKENFSDGCIGTVDVLFPQAPFFLVFSHALTKEMLVPILDYASSPRWPYGYAPHDLGTYPHATGQVYGMRGSDGDRMPVEECGNMLIMLAALVKIESNADLAKKYWPMLTRWAD